MNLKLAKRAVRLAYRWTRGQRICRNCLRFPFACNHIHWTKKERREYIEKIKNEPPLFLRTENGLIRNPDHPRNVGLDPKAGIRKITRRTE